MFHTKSLVSSRFTTSFPALTTLSSVTPLTLTRSFATKPTVKPSDARFGSGPCKKRPGYDLATVMKTAPLGRSHRSKLGKAKLKESIDLSKEILGVPSDYVLGIVPGSDTGAFEMAMWSMLGTKPIDAFYWESFGKGWVTDINDHLKLADSTIVHKADYGELPDMKKARKEADLIFTFNGTTSGVRVDNLDWIKKDREGLSFCDATSAAFAMDIDWSKIDILTYSWQKVLGGEGAHGVLIMSPRAIQRLETVPSKYALPKVFRMTKKGKLDAEIFEGSTINTPSMLCVEDYLDALHWAKKLGGQPALKKITEKNLKIIDDFTKTVPWCKFLAKRPEITSSTSICLSITDLNKDEIKTMVSLLEKENVAQDIGSYRDAPPGLRIWGGATVENSDMEKLMPWLKWAHDEAKVKK